MISILPAFLTQITSAHSDQSVQGTTHLDAAPIDTAFLKCAVLLDFMAYILYVISKQYHNSDTMVDVSIIRVRVWKDTLQQIMK